MGKNCDFDRGMIIGARQGGLSISETGIFTHYCLECLQRMVRNSIKTSNEQQFCGQKRLVNERGQRRRARLVKADRTVTVTQTTAHYNSGMQKSISEHNVSNL